MRSLSGSGYVEGVEVVDAVVAVKRDSAGGCLDVCFTHGYDSIGAVVGDNLRYPEKLLVIVRIGIINYSE